MDYNSNDEEVDSSSNDDFDSDDEIESLISNFKEKIDQEEEDIRNNSSKGGAGGKKKKGKKNSNKNTSAANGGKKQRHGGNKHGINHLKQRVSELMKIFEDNDLFIPPPVSMSEKGKVWSSRIYGADKKNSRKNAERLLVEERISQLENCLTNEHKINLDEYL